MYLRTLVVNGFKSFAETKIDFPQGITAVVGPNGTGKSNIVDAILWAMGEQSVKSLRSERMEDVIFNGTEQRKPLGMVEASLVFSEVTPRELEPVSALVEGLEQPSEIMITRRLYRDGESEYYFNKISCRLKDIRGFLWNARAGTRGQSVIEQGNIEQLLNASPQERREFIEGTAGIIRYKKQKAEALRKLQSTDHNLLRVRDILGEVRQQLQTLNRQAKQAASYQTLIHEARDLEVRLLQDDFRRYDGECRLVEQELHESEAQEATCVAKESRLGTEREHRQLELAVTNDALQQVQDSYGEIEARLSKALTAIQIERNRLDQYEQQHDQLMKTRAQLSSESEAAVDTLEELRERMAQLRCERDILSNSLTESEEEMAALIARRKETSQKVEAGREALLGLAVEKTNVENRLRSIGETRHTLGRRIERLQQELEQSQHDRSTLQSAEQALLEQSQTVNSQLDEVTQDQERLEISLQGHRESRENLEGEILELQTQIARDESQLSALQGVFREELGYAPIGEDTPSSVRQVCSSIQEALAERMEVTEAFETALESALGEQLQAWIVSTPEEAEEAIERLKQEHAGKGCFFPLQVPRAPVLPPPDWWLTLKAHPGVRGLAKDYVQVPPELRNLVDTLLTDTVVMDSLHEALEVMRQHSWFGGNGPNLVTLRGEWVSSSGMIRGGLERESGGVLHRRRAILNLENSVRSGKKALAESQEKRTALLEDIDRVSQQLDSATSAIREKEFELLGIQNEKVSKEEALSDLGRRLDVLGQERQTEEEEVNRLFEEEAECRNQLGVLSDRLISGDAALRESQDAHQALEHEQQDLSARLNETRIHFQTLKTQWEHEQANRDRIEQEGENRKLALQALDQQLEELFLQSRTSQQERLVNEDLVEELDEQKTLKGDELRELQNRHAGLLEEVKGLDTLLGQAREKLANIFKLRAPIEGRLAEIRTKLQAVKDTLSVTYEIPLEDCLRPVEGLDGSFPNTGNEMEGPEQWRDRLNRVRRKLERIGPINMSAIEEHAQLEERYQFLLEQEEDLSGSIQSLQEIIQRLNKTTNTLFAETFKELQVKFNEVFSALFAGGRAELVLVKETAEEEDENSFNLEPGVEIVAQPPGKRLKNLSMLSGGEKTMTVMALLFASFLVKPSPFCVLDEVDAPLDENNVVRFGQFLRQMADRSQFIVITHNKRTMEIAHSLFGVTMEEPGVSNLVAVRLHELHEAGF